MEELARVVLVMLAIALVINLIQHGPGGVRTWLRAKMLGKTRAA
jgi:hypothetical protein